MTDDRDLFAEQAVGRAAAPNETAPAGDLPADFLEVAAAIYASESIGAVLSKRVEQALRFGHTPAADAERRPLHIVREVRDRVQDLVGLLDGRDPNGDRIDTALKKTTAAAAMLLALHDRLSLARRAIERGESA